MPVVRDHTALLWPLDYWAGEYSSWSLGAGPGAVTVVTYEFLDPTELPAASELGYGATGALSYSEAERAVLRGAISAVDRETGLVFMEVADGGMIQFAGIFGSSVGGYASGPVNSGSARSYVDRTTGDGLAPGSSDYHTFLHELGHSLGLKHPFEGNLTLPADLDSSLYTVMAYNRAGFGNRSDFGPFDIDALRFLHGPDFDPAALGVVYSYDETRQTLVVHGTSGRDVLVGNGRGSELFGGPGDDGLYLLSAAAYAEGGSGNDTFVIYGFEWTALGGDGDDIFMLGGAASTFGANADGGAGVDTLDLSGASAEFNSISIGTGDEERLRSIEIIIGSPGSDTVFLERSVQSVDGGAGDDTFYLTRGRHELDGAAGHDRLWAFPSGWVSFLFDLRQGFVEAQGVLAATAGFERFDGGFGSDYFIGGSAGEELFGGSGSDILFGGAGDDRIDGGGDYDLAVYSGRPEDYSVVADGAELVVTDLRSGSPEGADRLAGVERVGFLRGGATEEADALAGATGDDVIDGRAGDDLLLGNAGVDTLVGGEGHDFLDAGENPETVRPDGTVTGGQGDVMLGGAGNDTYLVDSPLDLVDEGTAFPDFAGGDWDYDTVISRSDFFWDVYSVAEMVRIAETVDDPTGDGVTVVAGTQNNHLYGHMGTDILFGRGGSDVYRPGDGVDWISLSTLGVTDENAYEGVDGPNTVVVEARRTGDFSYDIVFEFEVGKDRIDLSDYGYASVTEIMDRGVDDGFGNAYFILGDGLDYLYMVGVTLDEFRGADLIV